MKKYLAVALLLLPLTTFAADCSVQVADTRSLFNEVIHILSDHIVALSQEILNLKAEIAMLRAQPPTPSFTATVAVPTCTLELATTTDTAGNIVGKATWTSQNARTIEINGNSLTPILNGSTRGYTLNPYTGALTLTATVSDGSGNLKSTCTGSIPAWK